MKVRKICAVITARPSYSRIKTALQAIKDHPDLELQLVVAASALLDRYGTAVNFIEKDDFDITTKVFSVLEGENVTVSSKTTGLGILELSTVFDNLQPDIVITVADRYETMSTAITASYMNIPLAHVQGGEVTGNIDEKVRHAITKLSDYHFVSSDEARERVVKLGEDPEFVFNTGCPSIDLAHQVMENLDPDFDPIELYGGVGADKDIFNGDYLVVMQHPVTTEYKQARHQVEQTLEAIKELNMPTYWFWPNVDAGSGGTATGIRVFRERNKNNSIRFFKNMEPHHFLQLLYNSKCLIGNSSVGIRECSYMGIPVVNIGTRQMRRERGENVVDVNYNAEEIKKAVQYWLENGKPARSQIYGDGKAGEKIADLLSELELKYHKIITY
ncbi:MAG: UDP-N-acetylglucosamine 2-epimerase [Balneolaceae bacterium]|nr:UDP-N-acetylglucosamine 2-epimerase [Balneolaceae bacterium]